MRQIKVFIVDDHYMIIEGIKALLNADADIEFIGHASTVASCLSFLQRNEPDVVLLDINLPDGNGIELCGKIHTQYPALKILGLSTFNEASFIEDIIKNGASGYVLKNASQQELSIAIKNVFSGQKYLSYEASLILRQHVEDEGIPAVTRREKEVLALIADGLTNQEIADKLIISLSTVETHRKNLLAKFRVKNTASLVKVAMQGKVI